MGLSGQSHATESRRCVHAEHQPQNSWPLPELSRCRELGHSLLFPALGTGKFSFS